MSSSSQSLLSTHHHHHHKKSTSCPITQMRHYLSTVSSPPFLQDVLVFLDSNITSALKKKYRFSLCGHEDTAPNEDHSSATRISKCTSAGAPLIYFLSEEDGQIIATARLDAMLLAATFSISNCVRCGILRHKDTEYPLSKDVPDSPALRELNAQWIRDWSDIIEKFSKLKQWTQYYHHLFSSRRVRILKDGIWFEHFDVDNVPDAPPLVCTEPWNQFVKILTTCITSSNSDFSIHVESGVPLCQDSTSKNLAYSMSRQLLERYDKYETTHKDILSATFCFTSFADMYGRIVEGSRPSSARTNQRCSSLRELTFYDLKMIPRFIIKQVACVPSEVSEVVTKSYTGDDILGPLSEVLLDFYQSKNGEKPAHLLKEKLCLCVTDLKFFNMVLFMPQNEGSGRVDVRIDAYARPLRDDNSLEQLAGWARYALRDTQWTKKEQWEKDFCMSVDEIKRDVNWRFKIC